MIQVSEWSPNLHFCAGNPVIILILSLIMDGLEKTLLNVDGAAPLAKRFRALFALKALASQSSSPSQAAAIKALSTGLTSTQCSPLLKHELAYCLGQSKSPLALSTLISVLEDQSEDRMVRHEAAEAIGAIGGETTAGDVGIDERLKLLQKYASPSEPEQCVRETCEIAIERIQWEVEKQTQENIPGNESVHFSHWVWCGLFQPFAFSSYTSIDPAPPTQSSSSEPTPASVPELKTILLDTSVPLFERYRAMFALRNIGSVDAVDALAAGFADDSILFKYDMP